MTKKNKLDALTTANEWAYGVGHFINDLTAACWFNFLLFYLKEVNPIDKENPGFYAGLVLLSGQITDGLATPFVGYYSDRTQTRFGQRKPWYVGGYFIICVCFLFIFQNCLVCKEDGTTNQTVKIIYYCFFPSAFNVGWASIQVSHMSMVPSLTGCQIKKDRLNGLRNVFTYFANLFVLVTALVLFQTISDQILQFQLLSYIVIALGSTTSLFFIININENHLVFQQKKLVAKFKKNQQRQDENISSINISDESQTKSKTLFLSHWFKQLDFYIYGFIYMLVRLVNNAYNATFNLFRVQSNFISYSTSVSVALVPLISNISQILISYYTDKLYLLVGRKKLNYIGLLLLFICGALYWVIYFKIQFITPEYKNWVYAISFISGISLSISLNTGIAFICDVVGDNGKQGAFVYGCYGLLDKFTTGLILFFVLRTKSFEANDPDYIKFTFVMIPIFSAIIAQVCMAIGKSGKDKYSVLQDPILKANSVVYEENTQFNSEQISSSKIKDLESKTITNDQ